MSDTSERQRRHHLDLLGSVEFLHAERDDPRTFVHTACYDDVVALIGLHGDGFERDVAGGVDEGAKVVALGVQKLDPSQKVRVVSSLSF